MFADYVGLKFVFGFCCEFSYTGSMFVCFLGVVQQWWRRCKRSLRLPMLCTSTARRVYSCSRCSFQQVTKGSVSYLSSPCFSTVIGGIGGPARAIHGILAVMYWISIIRGALPPPSKMVMGSIPTGDAVTGPHIRGTLSMREMSL